MAAGGSRARADYDYLIKLLLIGDSGMYRVPRWMKLASGVYDDFAVVRQSVFCVLSNSEG